MKKYVRKEEIMKDYKKDIAAYLDEVKGREAYSTEKVIEDLRHSKHVCVFGIGAISYPIISAIRNFTDIKIDFLCDNDQAKWGKIYHDNLKCISPDDLQIFADDVAILITTQHYENIYEQLKKRGFNKIFVITEYRLLNNEYFKNRENIEVIKQNTLKLIDILEDEESKEIMQVLINNWFNFDIRNIGYKNIFSKDQYFPTGVIRLLEGEAFVDAGAYIGDTLLEFIEKTHQNFDSIIAFELDKQNFKEMQKAVNKMEPKLKKKIKLYNCAVLDKEQEIRYESGAHGSQSSCVNVKNSASKIGKTVRLSDILKNHKVTFIKMDIEGSELKALYGGEEIIKKQKPKLAISVYHKLEHIWEIPLYLKLIVPEYKIFLRHHSPLEYETVCYAIC
jgi:FkbM family methyltransferase